jgi:hypothetical protein
MNKDNMKPIKDFSFWKSQPVKPVPVKNVIKQTSPKFKSSSLFDFSNIAKPSKNIIFNNIKGSYKSPKGVDINPIMPKANVNFYNNGVSEVMKVNPPQQIVVAKPKSVHPINTNLNVPKKEMNWFQAKTKFPKLNPFGDADKDGVINSLDCKPFNKYKQASPDIGFGKKRRLEEEEIARVRKEIEEGKIYAQPPEVVAKAIEAEKRRVLRRRAKPKSKSLEKRVRGVILDSNVIADNLKDEDISNYYKKTESGKEIYVGPKGKQDLSQIKKEVDQVMVNAIKSNTLPQVKNTFDIRDVVIKGVKEEVRDIFKTQKPQTIKVILPQMGEKPKKVTQIQEEERTKRQQERTKQKEIAEKARVKAARLKKETAIIKAIQRPVKPTVYRRPRFVDADVSYQTAIDTPSPLDFSEYAKVKEKLKQPSARERMDMRLKEIERESTGGFITRTPVLGMITERMKKPKRIIAYGEYKPKSAIQRIKEKIFREAPTVKVTEKLIKKKGVIGGKEYGWDMTTKTDYATPQEKRTAERIESIKMERIKKEKPMPIKEDAQKILDELTERDKQLSEEKMISKAREMVKEAQAMRKESREEKQSRKALEREAKQFEAEEKRRSIEEAKQDRAEKLQFEKEAKEAKEMEAQEKKAEKAEKEEKEKYEKETQTGSYSEAQKLIDEA